MPLTGKKSCDGTCSVATIRPVARLSADRFHEACRRTIQWPTAMTLRSNLARTTRAKRFGAEPPRDYAERARQARFLEYRGFDGAAVRAALELDADSD